MSDSPFTIHGDEPVEARIVSWVLGEASAFEAAELERLCEERPELLVFRRRMRALHGLLTEAEAAEPDDSWKLPPGKRRALSKIYGEAKAAHEEAGKEKRIRHSGRRALLAIAACLILTVIIAGLTAPMVIRQRKKADVTEARSMEIQREMASLDAMDSRETMQPLRTELPPELIEGTPKPINVPDLEPSVDGPAGWSSRLKLSTNQAAQNDRNAPDGDAIAEKAKPAQGIPPASPSPVPQPKSVVVFSKRIEAERLAESEMRGRQDSMPTDRPGKPSEAMERDIAGNTATAIPVPDVDPATLSMDLGDGQAFGGGWSGVGGGFRGTSEVAAKERDARPAPAAAPPESGKTDSLAMTSEADPFAERLAVAESRRARLRIDPSSEGDDGGKSGISVVRESIYPTEYEPPELPNDSAVVAGAAFPVTPATPTSWESEGEKTGEPNLPAVRGIIVDGIPQSGRGGALIKGMLSKDAGDELDLYSEADESSGNTDRFTSKKYEEFDMKAKFGRGGGSTAQSAGGLAARGDLELDYYVEDEARFGIVDGEISKLEMNLARKSSGPQSGTALGGTSIAGDLIQHEQPEDADKKLGYDWSMAAPSEKANWYGMQETEGLESKLKEVEVTDSIPSITSGLRSGDQAISRNSIDAILNNPDRADVRKPGSSDIESGAKNRTAGDKVPVLGDLPQLGRLFRSSIDSDKDSSGLAQRETTRRQDAVVEAPIITTRSGDVSVNSAIQNRKVGKYEEARQLLDDVVAADPSNADAKRELFFLDDPIRTNPALTDEHTGNVDKVRRSLYTAEGNYNLGKFDEAKKSYEDTLRVDPYNAAARRGLEKIASAKSDYYRAAYDNTRSELLSQVDAAWEVEVPAEKDGKDTGSVVTLETLPEITEFDGFINYGSPIQSAAFSDDNVRERLLDQIDAAWKDSVPPDEKAEGELAQRQRKLEDEALAAIVEELPNRSVQKELPDHESKSAGEKVTLKMAAEPQKQLPAPVNPLDLMEEIAASEDPYSTFSLNISDASFQVAQAALAKGEQPDPAGIKVEQFYNAVDYGDPAPSAGEPVAVSIEQAANPVIPGRNLVRVALRTAAAGRSAAQPLRLTLLVDQSGSMVREDRRAAMNKALAGLSGLLTKDDLVTVIGFSRTARLLADGVAGDKAGKLADLVNQAASEGGTNLEEAINLAEEKAMSRKLDGAQNRIVLFTDGAANLGDADPGRLAEKVKGLRQNGIAFDIAGIAAEDLNDSLLGELSRNGNGRYYVVGKGGDDDIAKQLAGAFRPAAENVKVQVHFNPERVGHYKLIGFEKDRLKTEDFRNDAVDAAELAAEEAGVAIYQVEPLPGGKGELGDVSVRFRDTASGEMVERSWTIPFDRNAPAIDRASPSMQLAALAMLAGEKLKGGPLGDAIDFRNLTESRANVKQFYGNAGRVGEVLNMIDALK